MALSMAIQTPLNKKLVIFDPLTKKL